MTVPNQKGDPRKPRPCQGGPINLTNYESWPIPSYKTESSTKLPILRGKRRIQWRTFEQSFSCGICAKWALIILFHLQSSLGCTINSQRTMPVVTDAAGPFYQPFGLHTTTCKSRLQDVDRSKLYRSKHFSPPHHITRPRSS